MHTQHPPTLRGLIKIPSDHNSRYRYPIGSNTLFLLVIFTLALGGYYARYAYTAFAGTRDIVDILLALSLGLGGILVLAAIHGWVRQRKYGYYLTTFLATAALLQAGNNITGSIPADEVNFMTTWLPAILGFVLLALSQREHNRQLFFLKKDSQRDANLDISQPVVFDDTSQPVRETKDDVRRRDQLMKFSWKDVFFYMGLVLLAVAGMTIYALYQEGLL